MVIHPVTDPARLPSIVEETKRRHFAEIFGPHAEEVFAASPLIDTQRGEVVFLHGSMDLGAVAGWVNVRRTAYSLAFRNFTVLPEFRGNGRARAILDDVAAWARTRHDRMVNVTGEKPDDVRLMYLDSLPYLDAPELEGEAFAFGKFLRKQGFVPCVPNKRAYTPEEQAAAAAYERLYPGLGNRLRRFRKLVVNGGVVLDDATKAELLALDAEQLEVVMRGHDVKLGHFESSGRVSYRFDLCPICAFTGSSKEDDAACKGCCIRRACSTPWRLPAKFKEDYEVSYAFFSAVRDFLRRNHPLLRQH